MPVGPVALSPADGRVMCVVAEGDRQTRISIFLNIFDVHVNRSPISGVITDITYQPASSSWPAAQIASSAERAEIITMRAADGTKVVFKQIAGLIARRIICTKQVGDFVQAGERVGLIKFGSRVDVIFGPGMAGRGWPRRACQRGHERTGAPRGRDGAAAGTGRQHRGGGALSDVMAETTPRKRPPRAAYALPTLFTSATFFWAISRLLRSIQGVMAFAANPSLAAQDFEVAAKTIGLAVILDGLDGRIARMTNTTSEFGRELDSLADIISFGIAPAILAYTWGVQFVTSGFGPGTIDQLQRAGKAAGISVSGLRGAAPGAIQRAEESAAAQSGAAASEIFCRPADTGGRRHGRGSVFMDWTATRLRGSSAPLPGWR